MNNAGFKMSSDSKNRVVPWLSKQEWQRTYQLVFSENFDDRLKGFEELRIWKSRVAKLPLGVECTLYLLSPILQDKAERSDYSCSADIELQLMYSTSIIRFVNLVSHLGQVEQRHQAITSIAEKVGIPDWLVSSIRHEATHDKMPALGVLRSGASFAMDWLEENYWQKEDEHSADVYWPETKQGVVGKKAGPLSLGTNSSRKHLLFDDDAFPENILTAAEMLLSLLEEMPGRKALHQVQSEAVKQYAYKLWIRSKTSSTAPSEEKSVKLYQPLKIIRRLLMSELEQTISEWVEDSTGKHPTLLNRSDTTTLKGQCLAFALYSCRELLFDSDVEFHQQLPLWKLLDRWNAVPFLIQHLSLMNHENDSQITQSLSLISNLADHLLNQRREGFDFIPTVRNLLSKPHAETLHILPKLEKLQNPSAQQQSAWNELTNLLKIRLSIDTLDEARTLDLNQSRKYRHVFTLNTLNEVNDVKQVETPKSVSVQLIEKSAPGDVDAWTLCSTGFDWSRFPIGSLADSSVGPFALRLPCPEWEHLDGKSENECHRSSGLKRSAEPLQWTGLVRKRRRRGGLKEVRVAA